MEDLDAVFGLGLLKAGDGHAPVVASGIAFGRHDHAQGGLRSEGHEGGIQVAAGAGQHDFDEVAVEAHEKGLAFGIAEADVVLEDLRAVLCHHETGVEHAHKGMVFAGEVLNDGADDEIGHLFKFAVGQDGGRAVGAHAAGIGAFVAVVGGLVVLG